jgi:hypothetical protein
MKEGLLFNAKNNFLVLSRGEKVAFDEMIMRSALHTRPKHLVGFL